MMDIYGKLAVELGHDRAIDNMIIAATEIGVPDGEIVGMVATLDNCGQPTIHASYARMTQEDIDDDTFIF